eukprot:GHRR01004647.1.p1 GENE.GHRR01004647.1~~GHRR01004647.1.p1  ORF type:complete len:193 (+),score=108.56 GHRR01004647.1:628-1206(+)
MAAELLTQLQDQLDALTKKFYECVGVLQRDAPPISATGEAILAAAPAPGFNVQEYVQEMSKEIVELVSQTDKLLQLLPDGLGVHPLNSQTLEPLAAAAADAVAGHAGSTVAAPNSDQQQQQHHEAGQTGHQQTPNGLHDFMQEVWQLQHEHQQVSNELAAAVAEGEKLLFLLQQMYAALAHAKLQLLAKPLG